MFCYSIDNFNETAKKGFHWRNLVLARHVISHVRTSESFSWFTYKDGETGQSDWPDNHHPKEDPTQRETLVRWPATPVTLYWIGIKRWMDQSACVTFPDRKKKGSLAFCLHFEIFLGVIAQKPKQTFRNRSRWRDFCIGEGSHIHRVPPSFPTNLLVTIVFQANTCKIP
jgi:hypothetical protein